MKIQKFIVGMLFTNCYLPYDEETKTAIIIDPGFDVYSEAEQIVNFVDKEELSVKLVVNTHGHHDHVGGNRFLKKKYNVPICIHAHDSISVGSSVSETTPANLLLSEGETVEFGRMKLRVLHTPGHTPGSICLVGDQVIFSGDTLFAGGIGRTDFPGGSDGDIKLSLERLFCFPDVFAVYPGHGPSTTVGAEKWLNHFLRKV